MSVRKSLLWSYGSQAVTVLSSFAASVIAARLLGPRELGIFALASAISALSATFVSFGTQAYLVREKEVSRELMRTAFTVNATLNIALALVIMGASWVEATIGGQREVAHILLLLGIAPLFSLFEFLPSTLYVREMTYSVISSINVARVLLSSGGSVALLFAGVGTQSLALGPLAAAIFCAATYTALRWRDVTFRPSFRGFRPVLIFGLQIVSISGVAQMAARASDIILARMLGLPALGLYARASSLANLLFANVYGVATGIIFVRLSKELHETGSLHHTFVRALRLITAVMWPLLIGIAVLARPAITILYGDRWLGAAGPLSILMIWQFIALGFGMNWELFVLRNETARQTKFEAIRAVLGLIAFTIGSLLSISAAALGRVVESATGYLLYRPWIDRMAGTRPGEVERIYGESLLLTVVATAPALVLMTVVGWNPHVSRAALVLAVLLGIIGWGSMLIRRNHPLLAEIRLLRDGVRAKRTG